MLQGQSPWITERPFRDLPEYNGRARKAPESLGPAVPEPIVAKSAPCA